MDEAPSRIEMRGTVEATAVSCLRVPAGRRTSLGRSTSGPARSHERPSGGMKNFLPRVRQQRDQFVDDHYHQSALLRCWWKLRFAHRPKTAPADASHRTSAWPRKHRDSRTRRKPRIEGIYVFQCGADGSPSDKEPCSRDEPHLSHMAKSSPSRCAVSIRKVADTPAACTTVKRYSVREKPANAIYFLLRNPVPVAGKLTGN